MGASFNFTISQSVEDAFYTYSTFVGIVSLAVNLLMLYIIAARTPKSSAEYKNYILYLQVWITIADVHFTLAFLPVRIFPLVGMYCLGVFCALKAVPIIVQVALSLVCMGGIASAAAFCFIYRQQAILPSDSPWKLGKGTKRILFLALTGICLLPAVLSTQGVTTLEEQQAFVAEEHPAMMWIFTRGHGIIVYGLESDFGTSIPVAYITAASAVLVIIVLTTAHIFNELNKHSYMSDRTRSYHRTMVDVLILQVSVLFAFLFVPTLVFFVVLHFGLQWNGIVLIAEAFRFAHSLAHSATLLYTMPAYQAALLSLCGSCPSRHVPISNAHASTSSKEGPEHV